MKKEGTRPKPFFLPRVKEPLDNEPLDEEPLDKDPLELSRSLSALDEPCEDPLA